MDAFQKYKCYVSIIFFSVIALNRVNGVVHSVYKLEMKIIMSGRIGNEE